MYSLEEVNSFIEYRTANLTRNIQQMIQDSCYTTTAKLSEDDFKFWRITYTLDRLKLTHLEDKRFQYLVNLIAK